MPESRAEKERSRRRRETPEYRAYQREYQRNYQRKRRREKLAEVQAYARLRNYGLTPEQFSITDEALQKIITDYTAEAGVRGLTKALSKAARAATAQIVSGEKESVQINMEDIIFQGLRTYQKREEM